MPAPGQAQADPATLKSCKQSHWTPLLNKQDDGRGKGKTRENSDEERGKKRFLQHVRPITQTEQMDTTCMCVLFLLCMYLLCLSKGRPPPRQKKKNQPKTSTSHLLLLHPRTGAGAWLATTTRSTTPAASSYSARRLGLGGGEEEGRGRGGKERAARHHGPPANRPPGPTFPPVSSGVFVFVFVLVLVCESMSVLLLSSGMTRSNGGLLNGSWEYVSLLLITGQW